MRPLSMTSDVSDFILLASVYLVFILSVKFLSLNNVGIGIGDVLVLVIVSI